MSSDKAQDAFIQDPFEELRLKARLTAIGHNDFFDLDKAREYAAKQDKDQCIWSRGDFYRVLPAWSPRKGPVGWVKITTMRGRGN